MSWASALLSSSGRQHALVGGVVGLATFALVEVEFEYLLGVAQLLFSAAAGYLVLPMFPTTQQDIVAWDKETYHLWWVRCGTGSVLPSTPQPNGIASQLRRRLSDVEAM